MENDIAQFAKLMVRKVMQEEFISGLLTRVGVCNQNKVLCHPIRFQVYYGGELVWEDDERYMGVYKPYDAKKICEKLNNYIEVCKWFTVIKELGIYRKYYLDKVTYYKDVYKGITIEFQLGKF